ncbi:MAG: hypothetical protein ABJO67_20685, partial [Pseudoruegeria sp.]
YFFKHVFFSFGRMGLRPFILVISVGGLGARRCDELDVRREVAKKKGGYLHGKSPKCENRHMRS